MIVSLKEHSQVLKVVGVLSSVSTVKFRRVFSCCVPPKDQNDAREDFKFFVFDQNWRPRLILATTLVWRSAVRLAEVLSSSARNRGMPGAQGEQSYILSFSRIDGPDFVTQARRPPSRPISLRRSKIDGGGSLAPGDARALARARATEANRSS